MKRGGGVTCRRSTDIYRLHVRIRGNQSSELIMRVIVNDVLESHWVKAKYFPLYRDTA